MIFALLYWEVLATSTREQACRGTHFLVGGWWVDGGWMTNDEMTMEVLFEQRNATSKQ